MVASKGMLQAIVLLSGKLFINKVSKYYDVVEKGSPALRTETKSAKCMQVCVVQRRFDGTLDHYTKRPCKAGG